MRGQMLGIALDLFMELNRKITAAFAHRPQPLNVVPLSHAKTHEYEEALHFQDREWESLSVIEVNQFADAIYSFTPLAFCYFLPGFLCAGIQENKTDLLVYGPLIGMLDRSPAISNWDTFFLERWCLLTIAECVAVQEWVLWLANFGDIAFDQDSLTRAYETLDILSKEHEAFLQFRQLLH